MNELLLLCSFLVIYGGALLAYRMFGIAGLYAVSALATVVANLEVLMVVEAFGLEQTLGNVLFGVTFLITDILSENHGKKEASRAVYLGIFVSAFFLVLSRFWLGYQPTAADWAQPHFAALVNYTPRIMLASLVVYAISQMLDVWMYHFWRDWTARRTGDPARHLWLRNNAATLVSQLVNAVLFNLVAFYGVHDWDTLVNIMVSSYVVYIVTTLMDTPFVYGARAMHRRGMVPN